MSICWNRFATRDESSRVATHYKESMFRNVRYKDIKVYYTPQLDGGGRGFGQQYLRVVRQQFGRVDHLFEFCAGPGFIGFSLLANNLCERLTLADINREAVEACRETIKQNGLESRASVYESDVLDDIPTSEKWDVVVGNPPHVFCEGRTLYEKDIRLLDPDFRIHRKFYRDVGRFLNPNGTVMLQENGRATHWRDFRAMIEEGGLSIVSVFKVPHISLPSVHAIRHVLACFRSGQTIVCRRFTFSPFYFIRCRLGSRSSFSNDGRRWP